MEQGTSAATEANPGPSVLDKNSFPSFDLLQVPRPILQDAALSLSSLSSLSSRRPREVNEINAWETRDVLTT